MNISSNTVLPPDSQVIKRDSIGTKMYYDFLTLFITSSLWDKIRKNLLLFFNATATVQYRIKYNVTELSEERGLLTRFLLIQQKRFETISLKEAVGEYEFSALPRSLFASDDILHLPSDKYEFMKETGKKLEILQNYGSNNRIITIWCRNCE